MKTLVLQTHTDTHTYTTSVLWAEGTVVGTVAALLAEVDVGADAALQQRLSGPDVVAHAQEDLVGLILTEEAQGVHLEEGGGGTAAGKLPLLNQIYRNVLHVKRILRNDVIYG